MIAGLGLVVSEEASANLDRNKEFIDIVSLKDIENLEYIENIDKNNIIKSSKLRGQIREYGINNFSLKNFVNNYPPLFKN